MEATKTQQTETHPNNPRYRWSIDKRRCRFVHSREIRIRKRVTLSANRTGQVRWDGWWCCFSSGYIKCVHTRLLTDSLLTVMFTVQPMMITISPMLKICFRLTQDEKKYPCYVAFDVAQSQKFCEIVGGNAKSHTITSRKSVSSDGCLQRVSSTTWNDGSLQDCYSKIFMNDCSKLC